MTAGVSGRWGFWVWRYERHEVCLRGQALGDMPILAHQHGSRGAMPRPHHEVALLLRNRGAMRGLELRFLGLPVSLLGALGAWRHGRTSGGALIPDTGGEGLEGGGKSEGPKSSAFTTQTHACTCSGEPP